MNEDKSIMIRFALLAILATIPLDLFLLGILSRQTAFLIFGAIIAALLVYLLAPLFKKRNEISYIVQTIETPRPEVFEFDTERSETETIEWSRER